MGIESVTNDAGASGPEWSRREFLTTSFGALAATSLLGCGSSATDPSPPGSSEPDPRLTAQPGQPTKQPVLGRSFLELGDPRDGFMFVPQSYSPDTPVPLLVALHGSASSASFWVRYEDEAEARRMVLLAPDSRSETWDLVEGTLGPDIRFIDRALAHAFDRVRVDPSRIALAGLSDGASYAISIGVSNGDLFTHLIAHSPGFFIPFDPIVGMPRIYVSHGSQDPVLPVATTRDLIVPNFQQAGYEVRYDEFDGGHEIPAEITESSLDWFLGSVPSSTARGDGV